MSLDSTVSGDLLWEIVRSQNAFLVKRKSGGGVQFSRDPFNLTNKHSRKYDSLSNNKAISIQPNGDKGVSLKTKKGKDSNKVSSAYNSHNYSSSTSNRKIYKSIADAVGKNSYRSDLTGAAVSRASHIRDSQRVKKDAPAKKPRGLKGAKKAEA